MTILTRIFGGWKTWGPNRIAGDGALSSGESAAAAALYSNVSEETAMRLGAVWACMHLRAETKGTLPLHLRDDKKNILKDHDLYGVLHYSPNALQTAPEYWSQQAAISDMHGNSLSLIQRRSNGSVISLEPLGAEVSQNYTIEQERSGKHYYKIGTDKFDISQVLHLKGFSMDGVSGMGRMAAGRAILASQIDANDSAMRAFRNGLKVGGFLMNKGTQNWDVTQITDIKKRLDNHALPENAGKWMTLLTNMEPVGGEKFSVKPADAQLLESRYFGIEEICRLFNVPPQLIGHSDKASSWASSLEHVNLFYLMYSLTPDLVRTEQRILKSLIPREQWGKIEAKFSIQGLLRADLKSRTAFYASALQNGYHNRDEVRDFEERGSIPGGDQFTVQTNLIDVNDLGAAVAAAAGKKTGEDQ